ncbi:MAG: hypothetical protein WCW25_03425 [Patescibacteria group bacterium]|jgi:hypothetical protein
MSDINENIFREKVLGKELSGESQARAAGDRLRQDKAESASKKRTENQTAGNRRGLRMPETGSGNNGNMDSMRDEQDGDKNNEPERLNDPVEQAKAAGDLAKGEKEAKEKGDKKKDESGEEGLVQGFFAKKIKNKIYSSIPGFNLVWALWRFLSGKKLKLDIGDIFLMSFSSLTALFVVLATTGFIVMITTFMFHPWEATKTLVSALWSGLDWSAFKAIADLF